MLSLFVDVTLPANQSLWADEVRHQREREKAVAIEIFPIGIISPTHQLCSYVSSLALSLGSYRTVGQAISSLSHCCLVSLAGHPTRSWFFSSLYQPPNILQACREAAEIDASIPILSPDVCVVNHYTTASRLGWHQGSCWF